MPVSQTPSSLESLTDRELIFEFLRVDTKLSQAVDAVRDNLTGGDFSHVLSTVIDRLDAGAIEAFYERCQHCDGRGVHANGKRCVQCREARNV